MRRPVEIAALLAGRPAADPPCRAPRGRWPRALAATAAIAIAGCGGDDEPADTGPAPGEPGGGAATTPADAPAETAPQKADEGDERERQRPSGECVYEAPEGRLAEAEIVIALDGVSCDQGRSLARAAGLGQPAGANLTIARDGFRCLPSTREKGANVTYSCDRGPAEARFDVVWSAEG